MLGLGVWVVVAAAGIVLTATLVVFWDGIKEWLNNVAADHVEKALGYNARKHMHRAIATVDRVMNIVRNKTIIYTKKDKLETFFHKTTITSEAPVYVIDDEVLKEIEKENELIQEYEYKVE